MPVCYVVDVGHGNATVLANDHDCVVIDAGPGDALTNFLKAQDLRRVLAMLLSHADADHIGGAIALISRLDADPDFWIEEIYLNPDPRDTEIHKDLIVALQDLARRQGRRPQVHTSLGHGAPANPISVGPAHVSVLAPSVEQRLHGVAYTPKDGPPANANRLSAVILISQADQPWLLAPGDLDQVGFDALLAAGLAIQAPVLVYPHHGGRAGTDAQSRALANGLLAHVQPGTVIFSVRSADRRFPNQLTVDALLAASPVPALVCTGDSPTLEAAFALLAGTHPHRNGVGTQIIEVNAAGLVVRPLY